MLVSLTLLLPLLGSPLQSEEPPADPSTPAPPSAQDSTPAPDSTPRGELTHDERSRATLVTLAKALQDKTDEVTSLRTEIAKATTEDERLELAQEIREVQAEIDELTLDFDSIATEIDVSTFVLEEDQAFDLQAEVLQLVEPIVQELKDATEAPRQLEELRGEIDGLKQRKLAATRAVENIKELQQKVASKVPADALAESLNKVLADALDKSLTKWTARLNDVTGRLEVSEFQLETRLSQRTSILESTQSAFSNFFRTRGLNLLLAIVAFIAIFFGVRWLYQRVMRLLPGKSREARRFYSRLSDVLTFALAGFFALGGALLVLYVAGDWVLLGLTLLFLLGIAWASKTAVPLFLEQIRLLLDLGTVREHERIMYEGIPYKVSRLSMYSMLTNPDLAGGVVRLPLKDLIDLRSRPCAKEELWFPCRRGEWVLLSDGLRGKVLHQSPELVQLESLGGALTTFVTTDFLGAGPKNLSHGFRTSVTFGIDYDHQPISTTEVPKIMSDRLEQGLKAQFEPEQLLSLKVEFQQAGASSLDYAALVDWDGKAAPAYDAIQRATQRILVDVCNEQGWVIPFTQITLHQAATDAD